MTPEPTPFDITPIPIFPFQPPLWAWGVIIGLGVVGFLLNRYLKNRQTQRQRRAITLVIEELKKIEQHQIDKSTATRVSILVRRFLASENKLFGMELCPLPSLSANEIKLLLDKVKTQEIKDVLNNILLLEAVRFGGESPEQNITSNIRRSLENLPLITGRS